MDGERFLSVVLRPRVQFAAELSPETLEALHERAHAACFIANSVTCEVTVSPPPGESRCSSVA
jgi:organic hydroperoxide reductase OsmC/OhrA